MSLTSTVLVATAGLLLCLAVVGWRNRSVPSARSFAALEAVSAVWVGLVLVGLQLPAGRERLAVWGLATGGSLVTVALWLGFILIYTGREEWVRPRRFSALVAPLTAGATAYAVAPSWSPLVARTEQRTLSVGTVVEASVGTVGGVLGIYVYAVFLAGLALVVVTVLRGSELFAGQATALVLGTLVTVLASAGELVGVPVSGYPLTEVALGGQSLFWGYAVFRQQFLALVPGVARIGERAAFEELDDGVLVVGGDGTVIRANPRARSYLGAERGKLVGTAVRTVLGRMEAAALADLPTRFRRQGRTYQATVSAVTNWEGDPVGRVVAIRDVTGLVRRQQRLQVLNRVLRHNVRNDANVLLDVAERLQDRDDPELVSLGETVAEETDDLVTISGNVVEIERLFDRTTTVDPVDLRALVEGAVEVLADRYTAGTVATTVDDGGDRSQLHTDRWLLSTVLKELVENALEHAGDAPRVSVEASRTEDGARIVVADDGPGIPSTEVETIRSGEETDLQHATGLGLWLVYWGAQSLGGDVRITVSETGSTVTLSVPDLGGVGAHATSSEAVPERPGVVD